MLDSIETWDDQETICFFSQATFTVLGEKATRVTSLATPACYHRCCRLAHTAGHLQLDQAVEFNRVLHGEFPGDRLNEAVDDQGVGLGLIQATTHQGALCRLSIHLFRGSPQELGCIALVFPPEKAEHLHGIAIVANTAKHPTF